MNPFLCFHTIKYNTKVITNYQIKPNSKKQPFVNLPILRDKKGWLYNWYGILFSDGGFATAPNSTKSSH